MYLSDPVLQRREVQGLLDSELLLTHSSFDLWTSWAEQYKPISVVLQQNLSLSGVWQGDNDGALGYC